jgi:hypothetical protein
MRWFRTLLLVLAALLAGCPESPGPGPTDAGPDAPCDLAVTLGVGGRGESFVPLEDGDVAEVIVGYQGFIFLQVILEVEGLASGQVLAPFTITLDGREPYGDNKRVDLEDGGDGAAYSAPLSLYFNDFPLPDVVGKGCRLAVTVDRQGCTGSFGVDLQLRDEDPCIHTVDDPEQTGCGEQDGGLPYDGGADAGAGDAGAD